MDDETADGWFEQGEGGATAVREGRADHPREWPRLAVEAGAAEDEADYYGQLHGATLAATRAAVAEREGADDRQLVAAVRALDDRVRKLVSLLDKRLLVNRLLAVLLSQFGRLSRVEPRENQGETEVPHLGANRVSSTNNPLHKSVHSIIPSSESRRSAPLTVSLEGFSTA